LFGEQPAIGESVRIEGHRFEVVGVLRKKIAVLGRDDNRLVLIPYSAMGLWQQTQYPDSFLLEGESGIPHTEVVKQVRNRLAERLIFKPTDLQAIRIFDPTEITDNVRIITTMVKT